MRKTSINNNISKTCYVFFALFLLLILYILYLSIFKSDDILDNTYNKRIESNAKYVHMGTIYDKDMNILAHTDASSGNRIYVDEAIYEDIIWSKNVKFASYMEKLYLYDLLSSKENIFKKLYYEIIGEKVQGNALVTSFDKNIMKLCYDALGENTAVIYVLDNSTGNVIGFASNEDYYYTEIQNGYNDIVAGKKLISSIGHYALVLSGVKNDGYIYKPNFLLKCLAYDNDVIKTYEASSKLNIYDKYKEDVLLDYLGEEYPIEYKKENGTTENMAGYHFNSVDKDNTVYDIYGVHISDKNYTICVYTVNSDVGADILKIVLEGIYK